MIGPAIDPETGEFMQPGPFAANVDSGKGKPPPTPAKDCLVVEKVYDQCFKEDVIVREFAIPDGPGEPCAGIDLTLVSRVECEILSAECVVVDVGPPLANNNRIITLRQDVEVEIELWDDTSLVPTKLCTFTETIPNSYNQVLLYVPPSGVLFGAGGGPFLFCEVVASTCYCSPATVAPGEPVLQVICTVKICKIVEVTAFVKMMIPVYGYCIPRPCEAAPQQKEIVCPPIESLFPPQKEIC